jgi:hypothetical protein
MHVLGPVHRPRLSMLMVVLCALDRKEMCNRVITLIDHVVA